MDKKKIGLLLVVVLFVGSWVYFEVTAKENTVVENTNIEQEPTIEKKKETKKISVDVKGAVLKPGVYQCKDDMNVQDVLTLAGGLLETASTEHINLSKKVKDEMVIIIYTKAEIQSLIEGDRSVKVIDQTCHCPKLENDACIDKKDKVTNEKPKNEEKNQVSYPISINSASLEQLTSLPGIGESKANDIISYRNEKGGFQSLEELKEVKGIGEATYQKLLPYITL